MKVQGQVTRGTAKIAISFSAGTLAVSVVDF